MSVLIPDLKVYNYIANGLQDVAYTNSGAYRSYSTHQYLMKNDIPVSQQADRIVRGWIELNEITYCNRYREPYTGLEKLFQGNLSHKPMNACQLLKYLECVDYNIDEDITTSDQQKEWLQLLKTWMLELAESIAHNTKEYKKASYCD